MRYLLAAFTFAAALYVDVSVRAETRTFIIAANVDGYGIDRCLASGAACGAAAAAAYCRARDFAQAESYRRIERGEITGALPAENTACRGATCAELVAIECGR